jgi:guanylate kinase
MSMLSLTGQLFVISAPSGVGKTTIIHALLGDLPTLKFSVSYTTRPARLDEVDGKDYHFMPREVFQEGIRAGRFLEWAQVHGEYYGTDRRQLDAWLTTGQDVLLDIDVQGACQVRCCYPLAQHIFILPPSFDALEQRLRARGTESPDRIAVRLTAARREVREAPWYDFIVVNEVLQEAVADLVAIVRSTRCQRFAQAGRLQAILDFHPTPS